MATIVTGLFTKSKKKCWLFSRFCLIHLFLLAIDCFVFNFQPFHKLIYELLGMLF